MIDLKKVKLGDKLRVHSKTFLECGVNNVVTVVDSIDGSCWIDKGQVELETLQNYGDPGAFTLVEESQEDSIKSDGGSSNYYQKQITRLVDGESFDSSLEKRKNGKIKTELLETGFPNAMMALAEVMTWAADYKGYQPNDWKDIPDAKNSLLAAACRHRLKRLKCEHCDDESGLPHLYHEAFNVMAQLELLIMGKLK